MHCFSIRKAKRKRQIWIFGVCVQSHLSVGDIAHESVHVATELFSEIGAIHTPDNQEPFAYLVGWIADCIHQVITGKFKD